MSAPNYPCDSNDSRNSDGTITACVQRQPSSVFHSCQANSGSQLDNAGGIRVVLTFDYELHTPKSCSDGMLSHAITSFQNSLADDIADTFQLGDCRRRARRSILPVVDSANGEQRQLGKESFISGPIMGVSSSPSDAPDWKIIKCVMPVYLNKQTRCTPMKGYLTIWREPWQRRLSDQDMLLIVERAFETATPTEDVLAVSYIGKRGLISVSIMNPEYLARKPGSRQLEVDLGHRVIARSPGQSPISNARDAGGKDIHSGNILGNVVEQSTNSSTLPFAATALFVIFAVCATLINLMKKKPKRSREKASSSIEMTTIQVV